ncbi:MAG: 23S rRNA (pseudouridine(1915)-N(3))-methyltransferase RlmH [Proteobacteria bacterium]|nr:23S rRNA (pseudouridine(1915)-N(3))-methyltransferase RlmH [Pseudomonadota bacterium]MBU1610853.1 23S rRNA (pseudouridine(1915)-N(3))-methyltransferase RlmH [Pseudomonadota bacterium]
MRIRLLFVGKLKESFTRDGCEHYLGKLKRFFTVEQTLLKDAPAKLPAEEKKRAEGETILKALTPKDFVIALDEHGKECTSRQLAQQLTRWIEDPSRTPCFLIGGPFGLSEEAKNRADITIALGKPTWPHELCRVMLLEQLYRAASINKGLPYHHD